MKWQQQVKQEINFRFDTLKKTADNLFVYKYIVHDTARQYGKVATFMPKPLFGDNGSGMRSLIHLRWRLPFVLRKKADMLT